MNLKQNLKHEDFPRELRPCVNLDLKLIYIHIPKCGGNSIKSSIGGFEGDSHFGAKYFDDLSIDLKDFKFASFVRNPWDRAYSAYLYLSGGGINEYDEQSRKEYISRFENFEDFVINGGLASAAKNQLHFIPQYKFLNERVDFVGKLEHCQCDFYYLCSLLKMNSAKLKHYNATKKRTRDAIFTSKMIEQIYEVYRVDANLFGYGFKKNVFVHNRKYPNIKNY